MEPMPTKARSTLLNNSDASLTTGPGVAHGLDQKFHCSLVDQRKGQLKGRLTTRRDILWWKICAKLARKSGTFKTYKLLIINNLTRRRGRVIRPHDRCFASI